ncbi:MAG: hypothetical protein LQ340_001459 [Diploschistes diacapsis]|nr:MAG: hypothetical protein LQ340_001459 [Diploschistes diacapsis]
MANQGQSLGLTTPISSRPQAANSHAQSSRDNSRAQGSTVSSANTYLLPSSPPKARNMSTTAVPRPTIFRTNGQRPACLVNASVTYCGDNQIYAFGGFDQYTDEVYNHVLRLDLDSLHWTLVDNYGDIPGVRMGMRSSNLFR